MPGSRRYQMEQLKVGQSVVFTGEPGASVHDLQRSIASVYRDGESMGQQGLAQLGGLLVFEGELSRPAVRVTRTNDPTPF